MTIISPQVIKALGYSLSGRSGRFSTANGEVDAPLVLIQSLAIGGQEVAPITVGAIELTALSGRSGVGDSVHGLLGMNFLQQFEFALDQQASVLELRYRRAEQQDR